MSPDLPHRQQHEHDHQAVPSDPALRVKALESLLVEKGLVDRAALDALVDAYENKIGPRNGVRRIPGRTHGGSRKFGEGTQPGGLHAMLVLSVGGIGAAAGVVQVGAVPFSSSHRSARRATRVWTRVTGGRGSARVG